MLEKSVLTKENLIKELKERYGFKNIKEISKILKASANIFKIKGDNKDYILKEYQSLYKLKDVIKEEKVINLLNKNGIPTAEIMLCINGDYAWEYNLHVFVLQKFVKGVIIDSNRGSPKAIKESAYYLSKINLALQDVQLEKEDNIINWLSKESISKAKQKYDKILENCDKNEEDILSKQIREDVLIKKELLQKFMQNKKILTLLPKVTHMNSHGDYSVLQFIYEPNKRKIKAILDLSATIKLPIVWEIIRSYTYIDPACKEGKINISNLKKYVKEYIKKIELSKVDLAMMPYVYLLQLLKSPFGYSEYVIDKSENRKELIKFAFWRTEMCKWLAANAQELSKSLVLLYPERNY